MEVSMSAVEHIMPIGRSKGRPWKQYLLDTVLAFLAALLVTGVIFAFKLYPRVPNISIVYLLVVLALASTRGRYAAILAAVIAFVSLDFFIVPPLYTFVMTHIEESISLSVFLFTTFGTCHLTSPLHKRPNP